MATLLQIYIFVTENPSKSMNSPCTDICMKVADVAVGTDINLHKFLVDSNRYRYGIITRA